MLQYSPKIVTDSLVMCLDASNNKSYPTDLPVKNGLVMWMDAADVTTFSYSSGTTVSQWRDKSGNNLGKVAGYLNRGVEITNPEFKKALDLNENLLEVTNQIPSNDNIIILISDYVKKHIMEHNKPGVGSIFKTGISENDIIKMVTNIAPKVSGDGGAYELKQSGIGYDLVLPIEKAKTLKNAKEGKVEKQEGPNKVKVPSITTSQPSSDFSTNKISLIIRKSNPQYLPDDVKNNKDIKKKIEEGKCYSLLTAFPGNPDIPRASEWKGKYAVVIPNGEGSLNEEFIRMQKLAGI